MFRTFRSAVALLFLASPAVSAERNPDNATYRVEFGRPAGTATCVFSDGKDAYLLTCNHVVAGQMAGTLKTRDRTRSFPFTVLFADRDADVALLHAKADLDFAPLAAADPAVGDYVWHRGYGTGNGCGRRTERPAAERSTQGCAKFAGDYRSFHGDSGSGLLTADGCVGAVLCGFFHTGRFPDGREISRASPASEAWKVVEKYRPDLLPALTVPQPAADPNARATRQTVSDGRGGTYERVVLKP